MQKNAWFIYSISQSTLELSTIIVEEGDRRSINTTLIEKVHSKIFLLTRTMDQVRQGKCTLLLVYLTEGGRVRGTGAKYD
jgi:hypothetical protein